MARFPLVTASLLCALALFAPSGALADDAQMSEAVDAAQAIVGPVPDSGDDGPVAPARTIAAREGTRVFARLARSLDTLPAAQRAAAESLLVRPAASTAGKLGKGARGVYIVPEHAPFCTEHFCIHWVTSTQDAPPLTDGDGDDVPDQVEATAHELEHAFAREQALGWRLQVDDGNVGPGNGKIDAYLVELNGEYYGWAEPQRAGSRGRHWPGFLVLDNNFSTQEFGAAPISSLRVTAAHELNHVFQFTYDVGYENWLGESTATWMEHMVYPPVKDYLQYLGGWVKSTAKSLTRDADREYGTAVFQQWVQNTFGQSTVLKVWQTESAKGRDAAAAYAAAFPGSRSLTSEFGRFAASTAEWKATTDYLDGPQFPDVVRSGALQVGGQRAGRLDHLAYVMYNVPIPAAGAHLTVTTSFAKRDTRMATYVVVRREGGSVQVVGGAGVGSTSVSLTSLSGDERITVVVANVDVRHGAYAPRHEDWGWVANKRAFAVRLASSAGASHAPSVGHRHRPTGSGGGGL